MIPKSLRFKVLERDGYKCFYCKKLLLVNGNINNRPTIDHKIPKMLGGTDTIENLVAACQPCNSKKSIKLSSLLRPQCKTCAHRVIYNRRSYCIHPTAYDFPALKSKALFVVRSPERTEFGRQLGWITKRDYAPTWCSIWMKRIQE